MKDVYINKAAAFLPNEMVGNDEMESYLGHVMDSLPRHEQLY